MTIMEKNAEISNSVYFFEFTKVKLKLFSFDYIVETYGYYCKMHMRYTDFLKMF